MVTSSVTRGDLIFIVFQSFKIDTLSLFAVFSRAYRFRTSRETLMSLKRNDFAAPNYQELAKVRCEPFLTDAKPDNPQTMEGGRKW